MSKILEELSSAFDLPADASSGEMRITLCGACVLVEGRCMILSFSPERMEIGGERKKLIICGDGLFIRAMRSGELLICGHVVSLELE